MSDSPFGAGQVSPRMVIKLNPNAHASGNGDADIEMNGDSPNRSAPVQHDQQEEGKGTPGSPNRAAGPSDAGPSRQLSVASHSPDRPSPVPSAGLPDRSFGSNDPAEAYHQPGANGNGSVGSQQSPNQPAKEPSKSVIPLAIEGRGKSSSKPATPTNGAMFGVYVSGQKTHRKVSCELCHRRKIKVRSLNGLADGSATRRGLPVDLARARARFATITTTRASLLLGPP